MGLRFAPVILAALAAMGMPVAAASQDVGAPCQMCVVPTTINEDAPKTPITLRVDTSLQFDRLILSNTGSGSAEIRPDGSGWTSGSIASMGARTMVGEVTVVGEPNRYVRVSLPTVITLMGMAGGSIRVESIKSTLTAMPRLDAQGKLTFRFGGVVRVDGDVDGEFRGDLPIDVDYF